MGAAVDMMDKPKHEPFWVTAFSKPLNGTFVNAFTKSDAVLMLYSASQFSFSQGRHPVFAKKTAVRKNLTVNSETAEPCVAEPSESVFKLTNKDISNCKAKVDIGHTDYRDQLLLILKFIQFRE